MPEVVTIVSAHIPPERVSEVIAGFGAAVRAGMPERRHTSLLKDDAGIMRIITVWRNRADLDHYLASTERPFARTLLERSGGTVNVDVLELIMDSTIPMWP
jgi:hypothetical protein